MLYTNSVAGWHSNYHSRHDVHAFRDAARTSLRSFVRCNFFNSRKFGAASFSGKGGIQHLISGPTGGFLFSYAIGAFAGGLILAIFLSNKKEHSKIKSLIVISLAAIAATVIIFAGGILGFMRVTQSGLEKTLATVLFPFIPGNIIKIILMVPLTYKFRPVIFRYTHS